MRNELDFQPFSQRKEIKSVAYRWRAQYPTDIKTAVSESTAAVQTKLDALDLNTCSADEIDAIIGTKGWASLFCSVCCEYHSKGIIFNNHGDSSCNVCRSCLRAALSVLDHQ